MTKLYSIVRDENGIPHIEAQSLIGMYQGQGYAHAKDRGMQILFMRLIGQGRLSEFLDSSDDSLKVDRFFRRMNWAGNTHDEITHLSTESLTKLEHYCKGINQYFEKSTPLELRLLGYKHEKWEMSDSLLISRMVGYLTLAQSQGEIERLVIEMVQAGVSDEKLEQLFPGLLNELDRELINRVKLEERIVSNQILWDVGIPRMMASNNWVISGSKTKSGKAILANDPHLEVNRLPNVWCEVVLSSKQQYSIGSSIPGIPGVLVGRNEHLAWGATYAFVDTIDSWIEHCHKGQYYREDNDSWTDFICRSEVIKRKNKSDVTVNFYENELGTLEGNPYQQKYCLITRWAAADSGSASVEAVLGMFNAKTVEQGQTIYGQIETGWNYVFADFKGDIGFQMSGRVPKRREGLSGLIPTAAWQSKNHWQGFIELKDMPSVVNPECGFFCTANEDLNQYGKASPSNMPMGSYRSERIAALLSQGSNFTVDKVAEMHFDVFSLQAKKFMSILKPLLADSEQEKILQDWDFCYDADSKGAYLFEKFYQQLYKNIFGKQGLGENVVAFLQQETGTFIDFYANFDNILFSESSAWFEGKSREAIFKTAAEQALVVEAKAWKVNQQYKMNNIIFDGKLPDFLGFDKGPFTAIGGRATIHQGQIYRSANRETTFMPSLRMIIDFSEAFVHSNLAGGPSDRRFSKWYVSDLNNWLEGRYKVVSSEITQVKNKF